MIDTSISAKDLLFTLLLKVGVSASFAALLARWNTFRRVLFTEERDPDQKLKLMLFMTPPLIVGVAQWFLATPVVFGCGWPFLQRAGVSVAELVVRD